MLENRLTDLPFLEGEIQREVLDLSKEEQEKVVEPRVEDVVVLPDDAMKVLSKVTVKGVTADIDENIKAENIKLGVNILGIEGNVAPDKPDQEKTIYPSEEEQVVVADLGYELGRVIAKPVETESFEITPSTSEQIVKASDGKFIKEVKVGAIEQGEYFVKVIDYDGTILKEANLNTGDTFELPTPPSHNGLLFQEWSCSQDIIDNVITIEDNNVMVGAVYTTASGLSEFDIELTKVTGLDVTLNMDGTKDWGDGTSDDLTTHTYTNYGAYTIKCNGTTMTTSSSFGLFGQSSNIKNYYCVNVRFAGVISISGYAFQYCNSLTNITIPSSVTSIEYGAFQQCYSLISVTISDSVTNIAGNMFQSCYSLTSITIPNSITRINGFMLANCRSLASVVIPNNVTRIDSNVFGNCYSLTNIIIPDGVTSVGESVFSNCYSLTNIKIPNGVTIIENNLFRECYSLISVTIPNTVTMIDGSAFYNCYSLTNIIIPDGVTRIGTYAFYYCYSLTNIKIPNNVTIIDSGVFIECYSITTYDFSTHTNIPTLGSATTLRSINAIAKIIVPDNLYDEWIVATNWATYADYIYKASEVQE